MKRKTLLLGELLFLVAATQLNLDPTLYGALFDEFLATNSKHEINWPGSDINNRILAATRDADVTQGQKQSDMQELIDTRKLSIVQNKDLEKLATAVEKYGRKTTRKHNPLSYLAALWDCFKVTQNGPHFNFI
eukprot:gnl/Spiro4/11413_TR6024_c0_g1_i2.p1 gnl/Spiro4/11413_TR6024_c0_g1~~gnl/Spiro4/11413_TR6024_c0_g1_i2.p1  ORF type:complete len:133 (-),score=25.53 gnl/Spiro4/11413_TR6024_c0_g1_i2:55-453(-)